MEVYIHERLPNADSLRLLFIEPLASPRDDIHASLKTFPLGRDQEYCALSYSWGMENGDASIRERILVDGKHFGVTRNLLDGLRRIFTRGGHNLPIWVDAVCIDQSNIGERNSQVARMAQIYANATKVLCWLGEGRSQGEMDNLAACLACLTTARHEHFREHPIALQNGSMTYACLFHAACSAANGLRWYYHKGMATTTGVLQLPSCIQDLFPIDDLSISVLAGQTLLEAFFMRRYWTRRWIVQELCQARGSVLLLFANHTLELEQLMTILHHKSPLRDLGAFVMDHFGRSELASGWDLRRLYGPITAIMKMRRDVINRWQGVLLEAFVKNCSSFKCSDPRDVVYSLLSLDPRSSLWPDYNLTTEQVYTAFSADLLKRGAAVGAFLDAVIFQRFQKDELTAALPSWCLDLRESWGQFHPKLDLGPCKVDTSGLLTCSALLMGRLGENTASVLYSVPVASAIVRKDKELIAASSKLEYLTSFRSGECSPGDLVCAFKVIYGRADGNFTNFTATVLHPLQEEKATYRIVGLATFELSEGRDRDLPVEVVRIR